MPRETERFLAALAADASGRQKQIASEAFPTSRVEVGEAQVSNMLAGRRHLVVSVLLEVMGDPERTETLRFLAERAGFDLQRRRVLSEADLLEEVLAQRAELRERMERIDETLLTLAERRGPVRVPSRADAERRRA
jgi:hypothetical protein